MNPNASHLRRAVAALTVLLAQLKRAPGLGNEERKRRFPIVRLASPCAFVCITLLALGNMQVAAGGQPEYELAYVDGKTVTINVILFNPKQTNLAPQAQADFYLVIYPWQPIGWQDLGIGPPICNPCDHAGDGITPDDFHDHVLDSMPADPGHDEFRVPWHVFAVLPAYTWNPVHDLAVTLAYAAHLPAKSEAAVDELLADSLPDGSPIAIKVDTGFYFLCAVVNPHAGG